jgi:uncharacterized protein YjbI with pentapeptide repeats
LRGANLDGTRFENTGLEEAIFERVTIGKRNVSNLPRRILEKYESTFLIM